MPWPSLDSLVDGVRASDRAMIGRAITLVESDRETDRALAEALLERLLPWSGKSMRIGLSGAPGAGKSTLLEALGMWLIGRGHRVAVLAVDPSSIRSGGSILGDKTRMTRLSKEERAFIRPTASRGLLGGVAPHSRDAITVLEAGGFDVVFVETVGVGQSEVAVRSLVDTFIWLTVPNAGDELQGIKRGILEAVDIAVINKADGNFREAAERARAALESTFRWVTPPTEGWRVPVHITSAIEGKGIERLWEDVLAHRQFLESNGGLERLRASQRREALKAELEARWLSLLRKAISKHSAYRELEEAVALGQIPLSQALRKVQRVERDVLGMLLREESEG
ncbi:MAG: methylmalonyl Co-A mutase-associated GTPase MeaB [Sandaracinaceae bacterium]|nr:methylmalonyl Co-A mutase-associated GTPase MeaB [Sandaracinaceae bacterium]MDW8245682.1 methylmalonyl Co-A mutase-associated GTPase MeaB [Sandaracinaceae bacterium]